MTKFSQKHTQYAFRSKLKQKIAIKFETKQSAKQKSAKNKPKKRAKFSENKPKNKQPASLQENQQIHKKNKPKLAGKPQGGQHCCAHSCLTRDQLSSKHHMAVMKHETH